MNAGGDRTTAGSSGAPVSVLYVDDDEDFLDLATTTLTDRTEFDVRTETSPEAALDRLDDLDCLVSDYAMPGMDGLDLLEAVRERKPSLPFVLFTSESCAEVKEVLCDDDWTEYLRKGKPSETMPLLEHRVDRLVDHRRCEVTADRALAAIGATHDGVGIVGPDGTFRFVNRVFASRFGYRAEELTGRHWRECYPDDEVERLESTALPTVRDDWQWTGGCVGRRHDGDTFTAQTRLVGLDDGSLIFCLSEPDGDE